MSDNKVSLNKKEIELIKEMLELVRDERFNFRERFNESNRRLGEYIDRTYFKFVGLYDKSLRK